MRILFLTVLLLVISAPAMADEHGRSERFRDVRERYRSASPDERREMREEFRERRDERRARFEEKWESAPPERKDNFCAVAQQKCNAGARLACNLLETKCN